VTSAPATPPADPVRGALVVVDVQHDFVDPTGALHVHGGPEIVEPVADLIRRHRAAGGLVVFTQDWHPARTPHFAIDGGLWPVHCVMGTPGAELVPAIAAQVQPEDPVIRKGSGPEDGYSAFSVLHLPSGQTRETELADLLDEHGVAELTVVGLAGDWCVKSTALDGVRLGYPVTVPLPLTRFVELHPGDTEAAIAAMREAGADVQD
jgi:nicotinamidase/pyrazinamidase